MPPANHESRAAVLDTPEFPPRAVTAGASRPRHGAAVWLGAELRRLRLEVGISQRKLTQLIGLSAHSNLGEYERGSRIPPGDIVRACERLLAVPPGYLQRLHQQALRERARAASWGARRRSQEWRLGTSAGEHAAPSGR